MFPTPIDWTRIERPEPVLSPFPSRRSVVYGTKGIVASSQPLATQAGLEILAAGGNAADAAVAVSAALNVTEPCSCGIGGDAFCLFYNAKTQQVQALNGSGRSPRRLDLQHVRKSGVSETKLPASNINSVTVPGAAAAWVDTIHSFGSGKLTTADVLAPAIKLADEGFPVSEITSHSWQISETLIKQASPNGHEMLLDGKAPRPGQIMRMPYLAETFRTLASHGKKGFYEGRIAEAIVELVQSKGGVMELNDLAEHQTEFVSPIKYLYGGEVTVYECPPNGQGITALIALGILEKMQVLGIIKPLFELEHNSAPYLHALIEAMRLAFADSQWYVTDPVVHHVPVADLLSDDYLESRAKLVDPRRTNSEVVHGNPVNSSDTVYFSVADQWGNACSFIQSNYAGFGTAAIPRKCGFTLQNRGSGFVLDDSGQHPNRLEPHKRPYHTIIPSLVTRGTDLFMSFGVMGGFMQPQGHVQVLLNVLRGYTVQAALDAPRFCISAEGTETSSEINSEVFLEEGIPESTIEELHALGHNVRVAAGFDRSMMGRGQIIRKVADKSGRLVWAAGSDPRADGQAVAQI